LADITPRLRWGDSLNSHLDVLTLIVVETLPGDAGPRRRNGVSQSFEPRPIPVLDELGRHLEQNQ
jgi:hypothetical protein